MIAPDVVRALSLAESPTRACACARAAALAADQGTARDGLRSIGSEPLIVVMVKHHSR